MLPDLAIAIVVTILKESYWKNGKKISKEITEKAGISNMVKYRDVLSGAFFGVPLISVCGRYRLIKLNAWWGRAGRKGRQTFLNCSSEACEK